MEEESDLNPLSQPPVPLKGELRFSHSLYLGMYNFRINQIINIWQPAFGTPLAAGRQGLSFCCDAPFSF